MAQSPASEMKGSYIRLMIYFSFLTRFYNESSLFCMKQDPTLRTDLLRPYFQFKTPLRALLAMFACFTCPACQTDLLCDEFHIVYECAALSALRVKYHCLFTLATQDMSLFMWQSDLVSVAKFVSEALHLVLEC